MLSSEAGAVRFSVEESFKGVNATEIMINVSSMKGTSCGDYGLIRGERYLVYAFLADSGGLHDGPCSRTRTVEYAKEDLEFLHSLPRTGTGGRLSGHVGIDYGGRDNPPLAGATITISNEEQKYDVVTNANGDYELAGIKPGEYKVVLVLPKGYVSNTATREVRLDDRGCAQQTFWTHVDSSISGRVIDGMGRPAPATLTLMSTNEKARKFHGFAHEDGEFDIDGIEPGRYVLYIDIVSAGKERHSGREEVLYYPGVEEVGRATVFEVAMGQNLGGYVFTLPSKLIVQTIEGVLQFPDGRPAAGARVIASLEDKSTPGIYRTDDWPSGTDSDEHGRFSIIGFSGNTYRIYAQANLLPPMIQKQSPRFSKPIVIKLDKDVRELKLILESTDDPNSLQRGQNTKVDQKAKP